MQDDNNCTQVQFGSKAISLHLAQKSGVDQIEHKIKEYARNALADNTWIAYDSDLKHFAASGYSIPASPEAIITYLTEHAEDFAVSTLIRRMAAINKAHTMRGYSSPTKSEKVRMVIRGIKRQHGARQKQAAPLLRDDLIAILNHLPDDVQGVRDRAILMVGFAGALRRSELTALNVDDIEFVTEGVILHIRKSKTDQTGVGIKKSIPYAKGRHCPVKSLRDWMDALPDEEQPLFRSIRKGGHIRPDRLSNGAVSELVKGYVDKIGLDPAQYSAHSLRSGCISSLAVMGVPEWKIMKLSGHKSHQTVMGYIRDTRLFQDHALESVF